MNVSMQEHPKHSDIWCKTSTKTGIYRLNYSPEVPARLRKQSSEFSTSPSVPDPPHFLSSNLLGGFVAARGPSTR